MRLSPLKPKSMVTTASAGIAGTTGATAGDVPWVTTSGSYTESCPVAGSMIVACTNACVPTLSMLQPSPLSWYGVASPCALSGFAGTAMVQSVPEAAGGAVGIGKGTGR